MLQIEIPGSHTLRLKHLVLDYNGTLAEDGQLLPEIDWILTEIAKNLIVHVLTADTFGTVEAAVATIPCNLKVIGDENQAHEKLDYLQLLGTENTIAIGNGRNDKLMVKAAALGIAVIQTEGAWSGTLRQADVVCSSILAALNLLRYPDRLVATMRM